MRVKELNATKDKFFALIAHDLKNPLSSFLTSSGLLSGYYDRLSDEEKIKMADSIHTSAKRLRNLLENLLQWSMAQTGAIERKPIQLNLRVAVKTNIDLFRMKAEEKNISIINKVEEDVFVFADENMLMAVIRNLISNAIKFTPNNGSITANNDTNGDSHSIYISDNGVGIKEEDINKIFRIDESHTTLGTNKEKGTGLGLILCKEFIDKNNGKLEIKSVAGEGTIIKISLPIFNE